MRCENVWSFAAALLLLTTTTAAAEHEAAGQATSTPRMPHALENTGALALGAEFLGAIAVFAVYSIAAGDPATSCGWCSTNGFDRSMRRALVMDDARTPATLSHVASLGIAPLIAFSGTIVPAFSHGRASYALEDSIIIFNTFVLTTGIADGTKKLTDRQRPGFHYEREDETEAHALPEEEFLSFYSGDTAWAFSFVSSSATLAFLRGYWTAPYVATVGGAFALGAGVLRVSADMHWTTDVRCGRHGRWLRRAVPPASARRRRSEVGDRALDHERPRDARGGG
jgi:membrane-associated phospholipid phosphatase